MKSLTKIKQKGSGLILVIILTSIFLSITAAVTRMALISLSIQKSQLNYVKAFYRAEAGLEYAKYKISQDPNWYTDLPHWPPHDKKWVKTQAWGLIDKNGFKIVKEKNKNRIYSLGYAGKDILNANSFIILYCEYTNPPLKQTNWEEL